MSEDVDIRAIEAGALVDAAWAMDDENESDPKPSQWLRDRARRIAEGEL